jgi:hypothetical protein
MLSEAAKGKEKPAAPEPVPATPPPPLPAYPPPEAVKPEASQKGEGVDFNKPPEEVLEFFRNHDGQAGRRIYLFDPIFQPVRPNEFPKSKATYHQTP